MAREARYCTTEDGVRIAYSVEGDADLPPLVWVPGWISHLEIDGPRRDAVGTTQILKPVRFITLDKRGTGLSSRDVDDFSLEAHMADVAAVVDDLGLEKFALAGGSEGGPVAIGFAARYPARVTKLVIYGSFANAASVGGSEAMRQALLTVVKEEWGMASKLLSEFFVNGDSYVTPDEFAIYERLAANPTEAHATLQAMMAVDVRSQLSEIRAPTLVIHARDDRMVPLALGQEIAADIRGARFVSLPGAHLPAPQEMREIFAAMVEFVTGVSRIAPPAGTPETPQGSLRTVLFTDLVGHTEMMSRLGDGKGRDVLREHERITREVLKANGGTEVKTMGDGFMASFGSVTKAVECAVALQRAFAGREGEPLSVRVGLNAGEPIEEDGDLFGATVILASRIAAKADGGEILVADTVRGLCSGKGFLFADRGEFVAKGFEEPVRVYEVSWRNDI
jgi:class 3 adenylate cyclase/pimeloyl-ACP methyl ester carboxylesterase